MEQTQASKTKSAKPAKAAKKPANSHPLTPTVEAPAPAAPKVEAPAVNAKIGYFVIGPKAPKPRTSGAAGQASNTQAAWEACRKAVDAGKGKATAAELGEALKAAGLQYKTYVPYFTSRCQWLAVEK